MTARPDDPGDAFLERLAQLGDAVLANEQAQASAEQPAQQTTEEPPGLA